LCFLQNIADILGVPQRTIADVINNSEKRNFTEFAKDFTPLLYNIWSENSEKSEALNKTFFF
jgi:hypothetical protein